MKSAKKKKRKFIIIALEDYYNITKLYAPNYKVNNNNLGNIFKILKETNTKEIIFLGNIKKIPLLKYRPNFITLYYLIKIFVYYYKGDDFLLKKIVKIFMSKGYKIVDSRNYLGRHLASEDYNNLSKFKDLISLKRIYYYFELAKKIGKKDTGQSIIIIDDDIILREDKNGTDFMINKFRNYKSEKPAFFIKVTKPRQELKVDLPTIGPNTIEMVVNAGIRGIILEKNKTYIYNKKKTYKLIKKYNLLYYAI